jgi:hypothetical protein
MAEPAPRFIRAGTLRIVWQESRGAGAVVLPFGDQPGAHTGLHAECWSGGIKRGG